MAGLGQTKCRKRIDDERPQVVRRVLPEALDVKRVRHAAWANRPQAVPRGRGAAGSPAKYAAGRMRGVANEVVRRMLAPSARRRTGPAVRGGRLAGTFFPRPLALVVPRPSGCASARAGPPACAVKLYLGHHDRRAGPVDSGPRFQETNLPARAAAACVPANGGRPQLGRSTDTAPDLPRVAARGRERDCCSTVVHLFRPTAPAAAGLLPSSVWERI